MKQKMVFPTELSYVAGFLFLGLGTAMMERADFGVSMVVATAYLLYRKVSLSVPGFTFGTAEYTLQAFLVVLLSLVVRRFKKGFLFSVVTAVIYGLTLDLFMRLLKPVDVSGFGQRLFIYAAGFVICAVGVACYFHTYITPAAYELFVKELSEHFHWNISRVKTIYDCVSCLVAVAMSFAFFGIGRFEGVKAGTIVCALLNGWLIGKVGGFLENTFEYRDFLPLRNWFRS